MPHQIIEYSANLATRLDVPGLVDALHHAAAGIEELPIGGLRTRAYAADTFQIADGHPDNAFIAVYLRIGEGRSVETRERVGHALFTVLKDYTAEAFARSPIALSYEVQEIDPRTRWNHNNLRDHMAIREAAEDANSNAGGTGGGGT